MWASWLATKYTIRGEGGGFPQVWAVVSLMCSCCPWLILAPKVLQLCTNHFVWVVCRPVWVSEAYQLFLVPSQSSNTPLYPSKCCELRSVPRLLPFPLSSTWTHIWVLQGVGSASVAIDQNVVYVYDHKIIKPFQENVIHECAKHGKCIGESKRYLWALPTWPWLVVSIFKNLVRNMWVWWSY